MIRINFELILSKFELDYESNLNKDYEIIFWINPPLTCAIYSVVSLGFEFYK